MTQVMLCFSRSDARQDTVPVNTYEYTHSFSNAYYDTVAYHLQQILRNFLVKEPDPYLFWLENIETFETAYKEGYKEGYEDVYATQLANDNIALPENAYKAAVTIMKSVVASQLWVSDFVNNDACELTSYTVEEIPEEAPSSGLTPPVDPRYTLGEKLISSSNQKATYAGVLYNPTDPRSNQWCSPISFDNTVLIGIHNKSFIKESAVTEFIKNNVIHFYPLPIVAMRHVRKGSKWFAQSPQHENHEGIGRTPEQAIEQLAVKIIFFS